MISAINWVPKGASKYVPEVAEPPSKEEIEEMVKIGALNASGESDEEEEMEVDMDKEAKDEVLKALAAAQALSKEGKANKGVMDISEGLKELDMDHYDDEDDGIELFSNGLGDLYYPSNDLDPYLKKEENEEDEEDEIEDMTIKPTDAVILSARNEDEVNLLQVTVYEEPEDGVPNMYVHHDIMLPAFPLSLAWLDFNPQGGDKGNFVAVGMIDYPGIEIWDLDLIDDVQPVLTLGGFSKKKKGKGKKMKYKKGSHKGSVLGLAWNKQVRNVIASASDDKTVKVWDVAQEKCVVTLEHHSNKVQSLAWNRQSPELLLTGSFDKSVALMDVKSSNESGRWQVEAEVESVVWDPHNEHAFIVSLDNGTIQCFDKRAALKSVFTLHAHERAVTSVSFCPSASNFLATGSVDKMVKLWDISNNQPSCVASQNIRAGGIFSISFSEDNPFLLAVGGSKGKLQVWDTLSEQGVVNKFGKYSNSKPKYDSNLNPEP